MAKTSISDECIDMVTPANEYLTAKYKRSFAYHTVKDRLPVILTRVVDHLSRDKELIVKKYGEECREEIKEVIGYLSKLKNEMQTNKPLIPFTSNGPDVKMWNDFLSNAQNSMGRPLAWFHDVWLHVECYMYRRLREAFELTKCLQSYDPFKHLKDAAFISSLPAIALVATNLLQFDDGVNIDVKKVLLQLLKLSLWGNRCDLSLSGGEDSSQSDNPLESIKELDHLILVDNTDSVWNILSKANGTNRIIDIVFDNAGYEVFTDFCLADFILRFKLADMVRLHAKTTPWFVSDVMEHDVHTTLEMMAGQKEFPCLPKLAERWQKNLDEGKWILCAEHFWTLPYSYDCMQEIDPSLYSQLSEASLIIFKGDLNYRKLMGDVNWPHTTEFSEALRGFHPAPLISLRTIKADVVTGMKEGQSEQVANVDQDWMTTGKYAVISCTC